MSEFDARAAGWDSDPQKVDRARRVAEAMVRQVPVTPGLAVFEYGCGTGLLGFALQPHVAQVTLADSSQAMLDVLQRKIEAAGARNMTALRLDLSCDPLPGSRYDLACMSMVLHHIPDTEAILGAMYELLRTPGFVCISDLDKEDGSFHGVGADVHRGFDRSELSAKLASAGFTNVRMSTACEITKETSAGPRTFPVFLAIGEKR